MFQAVAFGIYLKKKIFFLVVLVKVFVFEIHYVYHQSTVSIRLKLLVRSLPPQDDLHFSKANQPPRFFFLK